MAGKKMKKAARKEEACCGTSKTGNLEEWLLVVLGGLGFTQALGYLPMMPSFFPYVWSSLVLVIGITKVINKSSC